MVAEGTKLSDLASLATEQGKTYEFRLYVYPSLSVEKLTELQQKLLDNGVTPLRPLEEVMTYPAIVKLLAEGDPDLGARIAKAVDMPSLLGWSAATVSSKIPLISVAVVSLGILIYALSRRGVRT